MADFKFQEWERLSDEVTDGDADFRLTVDGLNWSFRRCGKLMFVREEGQDCNEWLFFPPLITIQSVGFPYSGQWTSQLTYMIGRKRQRQNNFRVWILHKNQSSVAVWNARTGLMVTNDFYRVAKGESQFCPFHVKTPLSIAQMSSSLLFSLLQTEWENPDSDICFAARFSSLSHLQQHLHCVETRIGTSLEFARLIEAALRTFTLSWPDDIDHLYVDLSIAEGETRFFFRNEEHPLGIRERALINHIVRAFEPRQVVDSPDLPLAVRTFIASSGSRGFSIAVTPPSMHDRLEAMLELRNWLERFNSE